MYIERFLKGLKKYIPIMNIEGIRFKIGEQTKLVNIHDETVSVPALKIINPENIPFSYNSLIEFLENEYKLLNNILDSKLDSDTINMLIYIDDFYGDEYYIPQNLENELKTCIHKHEAVITYKTKDHIYKLVIEYIIDEEFDMEWHYDDFRIGLTIKLKNLTINGKPYNENDVERIIYDIAADEPYYFEEPIWDCIHEYLQKYRVFINTDWQYVTIDIEKIIYE